MVLSLKMRAKRLVLGRRTPGCIFFRLSAQDSRLRTPKSESKTFRLGKVRTSHASHPTLMSDLQPHDFDSLPEGFEYEHYISSTSNASASDAGVGNRDLESYVGRQEGYVQV